MQWMYSKEQEMGKIKRGRENDWNKMLFWKWVKRAKKRVAFSKVTGNKNKVVKGEMSLSEIEVREC